LFAKFICLYHILFEQKHSKKKNKERKREGEREREREANRNRTILTNMSNWDSRLLSMAFKLCVHYMSYGAVTFRRYGHRRPRHTCVSDPWERFLQFRWPTDTELSFVCVCMYVYAPYDCDLLQYMQRKAVGSIVCVLYLVGWQCRTLQRHVGQGDLLLKL